MDIKMFDVIQVDLGQSVGSEQGGKRPAVVVQNDIGNKYSPTVLVVHLTEEIKKINMPTHKIISKTRQNGLDADSMLIGEQIRTVDKSRICYKRGSLHYNIEKNAVVEVYLANLTGKRQTSLVL